MNKIDEYFNSRHYDLDIEKEQFQIYNKLCDKAKELIFIYNKNFDATCSFLDYFCLYEEILTLSPIEQILEIAFNIYDFYFINTIGGVFGERKIQKNLNINEKKYIADFYFDLVIKDDYPYKLKTPLIVECDGFEYHSNKKQVNYDYERETNLKLEGYDILRFTGTQIYNDPFGCVEKIHKYMQNMETIGEV